MTVLVIEPEKKPYIKEIENDLASLQHEVGGYIQAVYPFDDPVAIVANEEAKLEGLPFNRVLRDDKGAIYDVIAGTFLVVGLGDGTFASLSPELIQKFSDVYKTPEIFVRRNGKIIVLPKD